jgi:hypothetical protein
MNDIPAVSYYREGNDVLCLLDFEEHPSLSKSGLDLLVQNVILCLMSTPGHDIIEPQLGGGLRELFKPQEFAQAYDNLRTNLPIAIQAVEGQIKAMQMGKIIPPLETLKSLKLDPDNGIVPLEEGGFIINIKVVSMAGEVAIAGVPLTGRVV